MKGLCVITRRAQPKVGIRVFSEVRKIALFGAFPDVCDGKLKSCEDAIFTDGASDIAEEHNWRIFLGGAAALLSESADTLSGCLSVTPKV